MIPQGLILIDSAADKSTDRVGFCGAASELIFTLEESINDRVGVI
jgi:hypothetical protein